MDTHVGAVQITDDDNNPIILLSGNDREIRLGPNTGRDGKPIRFIVLDGSQADVRLWQPGAGARLTVARQQPELTTEVNPGTVWLRAPGGGATLLGAGTITLWYQGGTRVQVNLGGLTVRDGAGNVRTSVSGAGRLRLRDAAGKERVDVRATNGDLRLFDDTGTRRTWISAAGRIRLYNAAAKQTVFANSTDGDVMLYDDDGQNTVRLRAKDGVIRAGGGGKDGRVLVRNASDQIMIDLDGKAGDIRLTGADCVEHFDARDGGTIDPGTVVISEGGEQVSPCGTAYDRRALGVVAGAGSSRPAIRLAAGPEGGQVPVSLMGRVDCKVDASYGPLEVGDLLTTSATAGYAMRAADPGRAFGAVLGKALGSLTAGRGLVPVLVALH